MREHKSTEKAFKHRQYRRMNRRRNIHYLLLAIVASILINTAITSLWVAWRIPAVVSFDMKGTVDRFTEQAGQQTLDKDEIPALTRRFMATLERALQDYQERDNVLILVAPAVVEGAPDITEEIQNDIAQRMSE